MGILLGSSLNAGVVSLSKILPAGEKYHLFSEAWPFLERIEPDPESPVMSHRPATSEPSGTMKIGQTSPLLGPRDFPQLFHRPHSFFAEIGCPVLPVPKGACQEEKIKRHQPLEDAHIGV